MEIKEKAVQGDAKAQYYLGFMYYKGQGVEQDFSQAKLWFEKAAAQGHAGSKEMLKRMASNQPSEPLQPQKLPPVRRLPLTPPPPPPVPD